MDRVHSRNEELLQHENELERGNEAVFRELEQSYATELETYAETLKE